VQLRHPKTIHDTQVFQVFYPGSCSQCDASGTGLWIDGAVSPADVSGPLSHVDAQADLQLVTAVIYKGAHNQGGRERGQPLLQHASYYAPTVYHTWMHTHTEKVFDTLCCLNSFHST